jgi:hypothetical protein
MNINIQYSERNANILSRFYEMVRKTAARSSGSNLEFYSYSTLPALLTMQSGFKSEQL